MTDPGNIARRGYLETVLAIAVDGYLGSLDEGDDTFFPSTFTAGFGDTFYETWYETFNT